MPVLSILLPKRRLDGGGEKVNETYVTLKNSRSLTMVYASNGVTLIIATFADLCATRSHGPGSQLRSS